MVDAFGKMNTKIGEVVLGNAPKNVTYTSLDIQKEILSIMANRVKQRTRNEIGDAKFSILVDEARYASSQEQMAIILRFVNGNGILIERSFAIKSISDTTSLNLKNQISDVLVRFNIQVQNMRGQGYDGANNMRGTWNGLQALFLRDCPYAYYVYCFAHRLQLTLVSAATEVADINSFFSDLDNVINIITSSPKRINELKSSQKKEIEHLLEIGERETGSGANQIDSLQRAGGTRWSSRYNSGKSLIDMYAAICKVLEYLNDHSPNVRTRSEVGGVYKKLTTFEFVFIFHLMRRMLAITDVLRQALQKKTQDILTAMRFVHTTKTII
ncbi:zinc finger MYM-type protein 1-like [Olea europaea var. sylvestris]|uniref:zinc finger MYM-type protein 1-like n=1 Tax=Olea europaea var. sylvestris TaxID=158386 RepID=UPI000C1D4FC0|nr:zinc finger MYM-type protein 1-like [Olea europaea var. sylvestris]